MIPAVAAVLKAADPSGRTAAYACRALLELGDTSPEFADLASALLYAQESANIALDALEVLGASGCDRIAAWLGNDPSNARTPIAAKAIRILHENAATRAAALSAAVECCREGQLVTDPPWEIAAESQDLGVRDRVLEVAFEERPAEPLHTIRAVEGVAKFNVPQPLKRLGLRSETAPALLRGSAAR